MTTNPYQKTSFIKKYLLYGALAVSIYVGGKYISSRQTPDEFKPEIHRLDTRINQLEEMVDRLEKRHKRVKKTNASLEKEYEKLQEKVAKYNTEE